MLADQLHRIQMATIVSLFVSSTEQSLIARDLEKEPVSVTCKFLLMVTHKVDLQSM